MNSPKNLNYETRPIKFTERKMLLSSFQRICNFFHGDYQYIGMGGLSFTDFKLFHKELHINNMFNIEGGSFEYEKILFNAPYSFIKNIKEFSTVALTKIDLTQKTLAWLDYDGALDNYMFDDLSLLLNKLPVGSIYLITCNKELKSDSTGELYTVEEFRDKFQDLTPYDIIEQDFSGSNNHRTIKNMLTKFLEKIISSRNKSGENIKFHSIYNLIYQENRGANMFTFGGVITEGDKCISSLNFSDLNFINEEDTPYKIEIPNLTLKEVDLANKHISTEEELDKLLKMKIISLPDIKKYKATYKFSPHFFDVRI